MSGIDYSKLSDEELHAIESGDYSKLSDEMVSKLEVQLDNAARVANEPKGSETPLPPQPLAGGIIATGLAGTPLATAVGTAGGVSLLKDVWDRSKPGTPTGDKIIETARDIVRPAPQQAAAPAPTPAEKWNQKMHGVDLPNAEMDLANFDLGQQMKRTIGPGGDLQGGSIRGGIMLNKKDSAALQQKEAQQAAQQRDAEMMQEARQRMRENKEVARRRAEGYDVKVEKPIKKPETLGQKFMQKTISGAMAYPATFGVGYNTTDMANQIGEGDYGQAAISGAGTAGSMMTLVPKTKARGIGAALAVGAPIANAAIDYIKGEPKSVMNKAEGGFVPPHIEHMRKGGSVQNFSEGGMPKSKKDLAVKAAGYLLHTPQKPHPEVGSRFTRELVGDLLPKTEFDPYKHKGASILTKPWDSTNRGYDITEVSGNKLIKPVRTHGGQDFARDAANSAAGIGGASGQEIAKRILSRQQEAARAGERMGGTGDVLIMPATMGAGAENFSSMPINIMMDLMQQRELSPAMYKKLNDQVRALKDPKKGNIFENFVGFDDPRVAEQMMKGGFGLGTTPGELRKGMTNRLGMVENQRLLDYNLDDLTGAITDPSLLGYGKGFAGNTVIRGNPEGKLGPSDHPDYAFTTPGSYEGSALNMPVEFWLPDAYRNIRTELTQKRPGINESNLHNSTLGALEKRKAGFSGIINDEVIDNYGRFKEGVEKNAFDPKDLWSIREYMGTKYAKGGAVDRRKLRGGLGMLPMEQRTDMRHMGEQMDQGGGSALAYDLAKQAYIHPATQAAMFAGQFANPYFAAGMMGKDLINDIADEDYASAGLNAGLNALPFAKQGMQAIRKIPGAVRGMMPGAERSVMQNAVPAYAGGGSIIKKIFADVVEGMGPKAAREIEAGAPHTYPPKATGPWMRDYVAPSNTGLPETREGWDALAEQTRLAQMRAQYALGRTGPDRHQPIQYMGKYSQGTPESRAAAKAAQEDAMRAVIESRKQQYIRGLQESGMTPEEIVAETTGPFNFGPPWMP